MNTTGLLRILTSASSGRPLPASRIPQCSIRRLNIVKAALIFVFFLCAVSLLRAAKPDPKLVALVPPTSQVVAGVNIPPRSGQPRSFLLSTHNNHIDLNDFVTLWGVDSSRAMEQVIMVVSSSEHAALAEHSLLASGRFDQDRIYKSAYAAGAKPGKYRGISVLEIQPFARERDSFHDVRWLAMMDSKLALFGTIGIVRQQLDRYLDHSGADPSLEQRIARLRNDDATWCVARLTDPNTWTEFQSMFRLLDPGLADLVKVGDTIHFGIHYGRQVEFEYEVGMASSPAPEVIQSFLQQSLREQRPPSLLPAADFSTTDSGLRGVVKVSKDRYEAWIAEAVANVQMSAKASNSSR